MATERVTYKRKCNGFWTHHFGFTVRGFNDFQTTTKFEYEAVKPTNFLFVQSLTHPLTHTESTNFCFWTFRLVFWKRIQICYSHVIPYTWICEMNLKWRENSVKLISPCILNDTINSTAITGGWYFLKDHKITAVTEIHDLTLLLRSHLL